MPCPDIRFERFIEVGIGGGEGMDPCRPAYCYPVSVYVPLDALACNGFYFSDCGVIQCTHTCRPLQCPGNGVITVRFKLDCTLEGFLVTRELNEGHSAMGQRTRFIQDDGVYFG